MNLLHWTGPSTSAWRWWCKWNSRAGYTAQLGTPYNSLRSQVYWFWAPDKESRVWEAGGEQGPLHLYLLGVQELPEVLAKVMGSAVSHIWGPRSRLWPQKGGHSSLQSRRQAARDGDFFGEKILQRKHFQVPYKLRQCSVPPLHSWQPQEFS